MPNPCQAGTFNFSVEESPSRGERTWNFGMGCGKETKFSVTDRGHVWRIGWAEMRQRILEGDPVTVPADLAEWMRGMADGVMPQFVADQAVPSLTDWLNSNRPYLQYERDNQG